ncbi:SDR family NAD(P)-dependent oxidoreductase [Streptomyces cyaneofuscatus]
MLHGRDRTRGEALVEEIAAEGGSARFVAADLTDAEDTLRLAAEAGAVDILVSNAGLYEFAPTAATDAASFDRHIAVNTRAPFLLAGPASSYVNGAVLYADGGERSTLPA